MSKITAGNGDAVTMKSIAEAAGVSIGTVDRALNNRGRINDQTKEKILQIAKEMNYQRNDFARALRMRNGIRILAIYHTNPEDYSIHFTKGFDIAVSELTNYGLQFDVVRTGTLDPKDFLAVIDQIDIEQYDGLLINASGPEIDHFIAQAMDKGIAVATFNSDSPTSKRLFFCGEDHYQAGRICGELTAKLLGGKGTVSFFSGLSTVYALRKRTEGFLDLIAEEYPGIRIVNTFFHDDAPETKYLHAESLLHTSPLPDAIFCNSATGALPICQILEQENFDKKPIVIGYDEGEELEAMLQKKICTALVFQKPKLQAANALRFLFKYLYCNELPSKNDCKIIPSIVFKENIEIMKF